MPQYWENLGLECLIEDDKTFNNLVAYSVQNAKAITGYYGLPYLNQHYGDVQVVIRTDPGESGEGLVISGLDTHASGNAVWDVRLREVNIDPDDAGKLTRRVLVEGPDGGGGMAVIDIINADVLPSFMDGDLVRLQLVAFPEYVEYYEDEDSYADSLPERKYGKKLLLAEGCVFPSGLLTNRDPDNPDYGKDDHMDSLVTIRGTVKSAVYGRFRIKEKDEIHPYIVTEIDTQFGPLEIVHTMEQVDEALRKNIHKGAVVNMVGILSGDAAINEYENGIVRDEEHDLALLRYIFADHDPERLRRVLKDDTVYFAEYNDLEFIGPDEIINRIRDVQETGNRPHFAHLATIISIDDDDEIIEPPEYAVGKRCIVLASKEETEYESVAFIDVDEDGNISKLRTSIDPRYHFRIDEKIKRPVLEDFIDLQSVSEAIIGRARFHGLIDDSVTNDAILSDSENTSTYKNNIRQMFESVPDTTDDKQQKDYYRNLFGYLFAKAAEMEYAETHRNSSFDLVCSYSPDDCREGIINSDLDEKGRQSLEEAMKLGAQFYGDCSFYHEHHPEEDFMSIIQNALMLVQVLGRLSSRKLLDW